MQTKPDAVKLTKLTDTHTILVLAGPKSRALLSMVCPDADWSRDGFPWLSTRPCQIAGADVTAMSVSFSGELAWELHVANDDLIEVHAAIEDAGATFDLGRFGLYATESMRIEKGYRHWKADLITEFDPLESNLGRFLRLDHDFPGRDALEAKEGQPLRRTFVTLEINSTTGPAHSGDSLHDGDRVVGTVTSAAYGHRVQKNLAMGFIDPAYGAIGTELGVDVVGERAAARVTDDCLYDTRNERIRA